MQYGTETYITFRWDTVQRKIYVFILRGGAPCAGGPPPPTSNYQDRFVYLPTDDGSVVARARRGPPGVPLLNQRYAFVITLGPSAASKTPLRYTSSVGLMTELLNGAAVDNYRPLCLARTAWPGAAARRR